MKKILSAALGLLTILTCYAYGGNLKSFMGFDFVAPSVYGPSSAPNQPGLIVFDASSNNFYGRTQLGSPNDWIPLSSTNGALVPVGTILAFGGSSTSVPMGYLLCDGSSLSTTGVYSTLFGVLAYTFGGSGGSFNLPDLRGMFVRGAGTNGKINTANGGNYTATLGSYTPDQMQGHKHLALDPTSNIQTLVVNGGGSTGDVPAFNGVTNNNSSVTGPPTTDGTDGPPSYGSETRPANVGVNYIIKY